MKILKLLLTTTLLLSIKTTVSQITLDNIVSSPYQLGYTFYPVQLDANETKYLFHDTSNNKFNLYNMNFTPFMTNIPLPGSYNNMYRIMYVTRRLFDCDSSNIEFVYSAPSEIDKPFKILRTNGNVLFSLDSAAGPYCYGCIGGSDEIHPIRNTSVGTKLFLYKYNSTFTAKTHVYSLCGQLPTGYYDFSVPFTSALKVFPNPTTNQLTFEIDITGNVQNYDLTIYDINGKEVKKERNVRNSKYVLDVGNLSGGSYFYSLTNETKTIHSGKFIIAK
jgi:hypothetical protein